MTSEGLANIAASTGISAIPTTIKTYSGGAIATAGDSAWHELAAQSGGPGAGALDVSIAAVVGDVIRITPMFEVSSQVASVYHDMLSVNSGNYLSSGTNTPQAGGIAGWCAGTGAGNHPISAPFLYVTVAADMSGGSIKLRFYAFNVGSASWGAGSTFASQITLENLKH